MHTEFPQEDLEYWKAKYMRLFDAGERHRLEWEREEELLGKAVARLSLLAEGLDQALDPHLRSIRELVRSEKRGPELHQKLDRLLETLIRTPEKDRPGDLVLIGAAVVRFLESLEMDQGRKMQLRQLRQRVETGQFANEADLFGMAAPLIRTAVPVRESAGDGLFGKLLGRGGKGVAAPDPTQLRNHILGLLGALKLPITLNGRREQLLKSGRSADGDIIELIDGAAALIADLGQEFDKEHSQLRVFLTTLSDKLVDLEERTLGMGTMAESSARSRIEADQAVSGEVQDIRAAALAATDLTQLQTVMASLLDEITQHLESNQQAEHARFVHTQQQVRELAEKLQVLEQESLDLRTQLTMAHDLAFTDVLTKLPNRAAYQERVKLEEMRWKRFNYPISLLIWDIDFFKEINDRFGHPAGDKALQVIADVLCGAIRSTDFLARIGGEEFVMLLAGTDTAQALEVANQIRGKVEACGFNSEGRPITITMSCGIAALEEHGGHEQAYARADKALYEAKRSGRNRCMAAD
jgi:diguanylate cyclase